MKRLVTLILILILSMPVLLMSGCDGQDTAQEAEKDKQIVALKNEVAALKAAAAGTTDKVPLALYFVRSTPTEFYLSPEVRYLTADEYQPKKALEMLVAGPTLESGLQAVLPSQTRVLGVTVKNGVAKADFSREITKANVGSRMEDLVIASIVNTLTKFGHIERVQILVEGKTIETLAGHVDTSEPLARNEEVVRF